MLAPLQQFVRASVLLASGILLFGCVTPGPNQMPKPGAQATPPSHFGDILRPGEIISVTFSGVTTPPKDVQQRIRSDGKITLEFVGDMQAAGKTTAQLQQDILRAYVEDGKFFSSRLSANVNAEGRYIYVKGDVRSPNKYVYTSDMTVLKAIAAAGDFTDFANRTVTLTRSLTKEQLEVDCREAQRNPALDLPVYPDDIIDVKRRGIFDR